MDNKIIHTFSEEFCNNIIKLLNNDDKILIQYKNNIIENSLNLPVEKNQPTDADGWDFSKNIPIIDVVLNKLSDYLKNIGNYKFVVQKLDETKHSIPHTDSYDYTLVLLLNNEFDGGELIIEDVPSQLKKGNLIIFEAKKTHYVSKITKGDRYTLVGFISLKNKTKKTLM